jgi:transposase-like protein
MLGWGGFYHRYLTGLVTSDHHLGLVAAIVIAAVLPGASWQRCRTLPT